MNREIEQHEITWEGIRISVSFERNWLQSTSPHFRTAHMQLQTVSPARVALPMTETGYRSHFLPVEHVDAEGGAVAYALAWLAHEAQKPEWQAQQGKSQQLSLF